MSPLDFTPAPPEWRLDWQGICEAFDWIRRMQGCPQDPLWHAEGDVWIHTRMVVEALSALPEWQALPEPERRLTFAAALLHDLAKPDTTREEGGRITARGHSRRGAIDARRMLWEQHLPFGEREAICALVLHHQDPFFLLDREDPLRAAVRLSWTLRCDHLALVALADALGREAADRQRLIDNVLLFRELCAEQGLSSSPYPFPSELARVLYFRDPKRHLLAPAWDDTRCEVVVMSGLPGAGKDTWLRKNLPELPVISLDALREELEVDPADPKAQGGVLAAAREQARAFLRAGRPFAWNATHLSLDARGRTLELLYDYKAQARIVYVEAPPERLSAQNRERPEPVPEAAIDRMMRRWQVPDLTEAARLDVVLQG